MLKIFPAFYGSGQHTRFQVPIIWQQTVISPPLDIEGQNIGMGWLGILVPDDLSVKKLILDAIKYQNHFAYTTGVGSVHLHGLLIEQTLKDVIQLLGSVLQLWLVDFFLELK